MDNQLLREKQRFEVSSMETFYFTKILYKLLELHNLSIFTHLDRGLSTILPWIYL